MAKRSKSRKNASFSSYEETVNKNDELIIKCKYKGKDINQDVAVHPPCIIFFDPITNNFVQIEVDIPSEYEFVKFIDEVSE